MADPHSPHICEVCKCAYEPTRNKDGSPYKTKHKTCSRSCYNKLRDQRRSVDALCPLCLCTYRRVPRKREYSGAFCSHACYARQYQRVKAEVDALRSIGRAQRKAKSKAWRVTVLPEVQALRRIGKGMRERTRACSHCGTVHIRRYKFCRTCSEHCRSEQANEARQRIKQSEAYRSYRRAQKSKRRAMIRNAGDVDNIDPIVVFERARWRCHLCGAKTPRRLRGTTHDRAPELEHIVSLADGGTHTWGNVACSCRQCNIDKGAASAGQLGLGL